jgi:hypothetical protein
MFRTSVFSLAVIILMLGTAIAKQPPTHIGKPPVAEKVAEPKNPTKMRPIISPAERESMGLKPHTWAGLVDPEVYTRLEELTKDCGDRERGGIAGRGQAYAAGVQCWAVVKALSHPTGGLP